jgi:serine/threonine protein kinase
VLDLYIEINAGIAIQILEPLQGSTLHTLRKSLGPGEFPLEFASTVLKQICDALMFVHHRGIYHEALEPSNIWLMDNKTVKVLNFGLTRSLDCVGALSLSYASIQQYDREDPTEANDVYGLGCLAYYLYAGEHPFGGQGSPTAAKNNLKAPVVSRLSAGKNKILERSVAFDRADRIPDVVTFSRDFFDA